MRAAGILAAGVLLAAPLVAAAPAHAEGELELSADGVAWGTLLDRPLFDPEAHWVPGDVQTARFYVRNDAAGDGGLTVDVRSVDHDTLDAADYVQFASRVDDAAWVDIGGAAVTPRQVSSGEAVAVDVRVEMSPDAPNGSMVRAAELDVVVTMVDAVVDPETGPEAGEDADPDGLQSDAGDADNTEDDDQFDQLDQLDPLDEADNGLLPATGSEIAPWLPYFALLMLGTGLILVVRRRRDDHDHLHDHRHDHRHDHLETS